jgi:cytochrome c553
MNTSPTKRERAHIEAVKGLPCSVCDAPAPSEAHHIDQDCAWTVVALCASCHRDGNNGIHGRRHMWMIMKMVEIDALGVTIKRLLNAK